MSTTKVTKVVSNKAQPPSRRVVYESTGRIVFEDTKSHPPMTKMIHPMTAPGSIKNQYVRVQATSPRRYLLGPVKRSYGPGLPQQYHTVRTSEPMTENSPIHGCGVLKGKNANPTV